MAWELTDEQKAEWKAAIDANKARVLGIVANYDNLGDEGFSRGEFARMAEGALWSLGREEQVRLAQSSWRTAGELIHEMYKVKN